MLHLGEVDLRGLLAQDEVDFASANSLLVLVEMVEGHFTEEDGRRGLLFIPCLRRVT